MGQMKKRFEKEIDHVHQLRDEIKLKMHLADLDSRKEWDKLRPKLEEVEQRIEKEGVAVHDATAELLVNLERSLQAFRDRLVERL